MTPKEARSLIRYEILTLKQDQIALKEELSQPHTPTTPTAMSRASVNAAALTAHHNALNELCGRKPSHEYQDKKGSPPYRYDGGATNRIKEIKSQIIWPEKSTAAV